MDGSLPVNRISGGGGDAAVARMAYFPPFISQFILLGTLELATVYGGSSATLGLSPQGCKDIFCTQGGRGDGWGVSTLTVRKEGARAKWSSHCLFPSLHSPFPLTLLPWCLVCVCACFFSLRGKVKTLQMFLPCAFLKEELYKRSG